LVGEGKPIFRKAVILVPPLGAAGLAEGEVGESFARAANVGDEAVEDDAFLLVLIEPGEDVLLQVATGLGNAESEHLMNTCVLLDETQGIGDAAVISRLVTEKRHHVAGNRKAESQHNRVLAVVEELVEEAGLKSAA